MWASAGRIEHPVFYGATYSNSQWIVASHNYGEHGPVLTLRSPCGSYISSVYGILANDMFAKLGYGGTLRMEDLTP